VPVTSAARWFVISLVVIGLGVFFSAIASLLGPEISGELNHLFNRKEKAREPMARCFWEATPKRCRSRPAQPRLRCWRRKRSRGDDRVRERICAVPDDFSCAPDAQSRQKARARRWYCRHAFAPSVAG
jgi:hypothetical protein